MFQYSSWILDTMTVLGSWVIFFFLFHVRNPWGFANAVQNYDHLRFIVKEDISYPTRIKFVFLLSFSPSSPWIAAFPSPSLQREPTPSPFRWPLGMPLSRTQKILQFMVSSGNCPVMPPPAQSIPSTYPSDNGWLLWKLLRPWGNNVGPQDVSKPSSYLVPE